MRIGERIRLARLGLFKNKSAASFSRDVLKCDSSVLYLYENNKRIPRIDALSRIAAATNVSIDWLVTGKGKGPSSSPRDEVK